MLKTAIISFLILVFTCPSIGKILLVNFMELSKTGLNSGRMNRTTIAGFINIDKADLDCRKYSSSVCHDNKKTGLHFEVKIKIPGIRQYFRLNYAAKDKITDKRCLVLRDNGFRYSNYLKRTKGNGIRNLIEKVELIL